MPADESLTPRRVAAALLTAGVAGVAAHESATTWRGSVIGFALTAMLGAAAFGFTRRSLPLQVASRGALYLIFTPILLGTVTRLMAGSTLDAAHVAALVASSAALWLARPVLHTEEARRAFAPARFREAFLAGATAMTTAALGAGLFAAAGIAIRSPIQVAFNAALAVVLLVAVKALLSMRTWGLLLGGLTSLLLLLFAPFYGVTNTVTLGLAAAPAILLWIVPLLIARRRGPAPPAAEVEVARARIAERDLAERGSPVAVDGGGGFELADDDDDRAHAGVASGAKLLR